MPEAKTTDLPAFPKESKGPPILLTKAEALTFAAERLEERASHLQLAKIVYDAMGDKFESIVGAMPADQQADVRASKKAMVEPEIQMQAMRDAAKAIRDLAMEERVFAAREQRG